MASELERLKVAFALYVTRKIVNADDSVHPDEVKLVHDMFPMHKLEGLGFIIGPDHKLTPEFHAARQEAVARLPSMLTTPEKEDFVRWFRQVCQADGHVDQREEEIVAKVEKILGK
jgi:uncharacterized tellurite resistance protein B-like protein